MDDLKPLAVFAEVVDAGSMSGAARRLGMSPSAVSQTIRALEQQGGVTLLHRSTRKLALTDAGERYYPHCKRLLEAARAAADSLQQARDAPTGELRVSAPVGFAMHVAPALAPLLAEAPQLRLRLLVDDAMIDLIDARIDVAIRIGRLADSSWVARRLCDFEMVLCASPDYLERHGEPTTPQALAALAALLLVLFLGVKTHARREATLPLGISPGSVILVLFVSLLGSSVDIPIAKLGHGASRESRRIAQRDGRGVS